MSDETRPVVSAADRIAAMAERFSRVFARELARVFRETERHLPSMLEQAQRGKRTAILKAARVNETRRGLRLVLSNAGYDDLAETATSGPLDRLADAVLERRRLAQAVVRLGQAHEARVAALQALHATDLLDLGDDLAHELWRATARGVFGSASTDQIVRDLGAVLDDTEPHVRTAYDTAVSIYGRQVEALQAGDDPATPFLYAGPADAKMRPFCAERVGRVFTREDVDAMDNGQLDNVFQTGGGYNCRHQFIEVSRLSETANLVGTTERVAEYATALERAA